MITGKINVVIYHKNCLDGFGAAYAAWRTLGDTAEYIPAAYGDVPPDVTGKHVYILDFSYERGTLIDMHNQASSVIVLDHHKTAEEALTGLEFAVFDMDKSGCRLAWEYFHNDKMPKLLELIEDRDLWKFKLKNTLDITYALASLIPYDFKEWDKVIANSLENQLLLRGQDLQIVQQKDIADAVKRSYPMRLCGYNGFAVNAPYKLASEIGNKLAELSGTFGLVYSYDGDKGLLVCSIRSIGGFDVSDIAKQFGGGGHKNAAGFAIAHSNIDFSTKLFS